jgi:hypothetical protein
MHEAPRPNLKRLYCGIISGSAAFPAEAVAKNNISEATPKASKFFMEGFPFRNEILFTYQQHTKWRRHQLNLQVQEAFIKPF